MTATLTLGSKGSDVERWQHILGLPITGLFDGELQCATIDWQIEQGLEADGIVGPASWAKAEAVGNMAGMIPNQITPVTDDDLVKALAQAYKEVTGRGATKAQLGLMVAQVALETGGTGKGALHSIHNYNLGNIRGEYQGNWTSFRAGEIKDGKEVFLDPGAANKFRAYPSLADGAKDYVRMLQSRPNWWAGLQTGTTEGFAKGLSSFPAYFTANPITYANVLAERKADYSTLIAKYSVVGFGAAAVAALAAAAGFLGYRKYKTS